MNPCRFCNGSGWVCVNHETQPWDECSFCDATEGTECVCNPEQNMPPGTEIAASVNDPKPH